MSKKIVCILIIVAVLIAGFILRNQYYRARGAMHYSKGDYAEAIIYLKKAAEANPNIAAVHILLATAYNKSDQHEQAIKSAEKAAQINPYHADAYYQLGVACYALGNNQKARENFEKAEKLYQAKKSHRQKTKQAKEAAEQTKEAVEQTKGAAEQAGIDGAKVEAGEIRKAIRQIELPVDDITYVKKQRTYTASFQKATFRVSFPSEWGIEEESNFLTLSSPLEGESDDFSENVSIAVDSSGEVSASLKEYAAKIIKSLSADMPDFKLLDSGETAINDKGAFFLVCTAVYNTKNKIKQYIFFSGSNVYFLTYVAVEEKFDKYLPDAEHIIKSIDVIK